MGEVFLLILMIAILGMLIYMLVLMSKIRRNLRMVQARFAQMKDQIIIISKEVDNLVSKSK